MSKYILDGKVAVPCPDTLEWAQWFETAKRTVAKDHIGDVMVSTVFIGLDHQFVEGGPPLIFETMIFGGPHDQWQERCSTWEEAESQHKTAVALVQKGLQ